MEELKKLKGKLSDKQKEVQAELIKENQLVATAYGLTAAIKQLQDWNII